MGKTLLKGTRWLLGILTTWFVYQLLSLGVGTLAGGLAVEDAVVSLYFVGPIMLTAITVLVLRRRKEILDRNIPRVFVSRSPPGPTDESLTVGIQKFGVEWRAEVYQSLYSRVDDLNVYIRGPYCPRDPECELEEIYRPRFLVSESRLWKCPICNSEYPRPREEYLKEEGVIRKIALSRVRSRDQTQSSEQGQ